MLDLIVIVAGFAAGLLAVVAINGVRRGSGPIPAAPAAGPTRRAPAPAPAPAHHAAPPPVADAPAAPDHGIRVNLPGGAPPVAGPPPPLSDPPPAPVAATAVAAGPGPTLAKPSGSAGPAAARLVPDDGGAPVVLGEEPVTLGRGADQRLRVQDTRASRAHAVVRRRSKGRPGWEVADQGSANGTTLNGHVIPEGRVAPLRDGDRIGIGGTTIAYVESAGATPPPAGPDPDATQVQR